MRSEHLTGIKKQPMKESEDKQEASNVDFSTKEQGGLSLLSVPYVPGQAADMHDPI